MPDANTKTEEVSPVGIGQSVVRKEDATLLCGQGRYTDDLNLQGQAYAVMVRSPYAHGIIKAINTDAARAMPGVLAVFTGHDLVAAGLGPIKSKVALNNRDGSPIKAPERPGLPTARVRFVGEAVACVVAESRAIARSAAEAVALSIEALPALIDTRAATAPDAPRLHDAIARNMAADFHHGDAAIVEAAFAGAAHVVTETVANSRIVVNCLEPRCAVAEHDAATGRYTLHTPSQGVFGLRDGLARHVLGVEAGQVRVLTGSVGGSFGMKSQVYPEQICLLHATKLLGRPVKWTDERSESFLSDHHGRSTEARISLALDKDGIFLAVRLEITADIGAYVATVQPVTGNAIRNIIGPYRTPLLEISTQAVLTNKTPVAAYRGAGRPEANYYMARVIDKAARALGIDGIDLRRRNLIPPVLEPHRTVAGTIYDSGNFAAVLDGALKAADWHGFAARRATSGASGRLRGRGISLYLEATGPQGQEMGGVRFNENGDVTMVTGTLDYGQGHASSFAQLVADRLGIDFDRLTLLQGDSDELLFGGGTGGSKSMMNSGAALEAACAEVIEKGRKAAGEALEAAVADIAFSKGRFSVVGTDRGVDLMTLAAGHDLDANLVIKTPPSTFPNGCHIAEVEIDPETGIVDVVSYCAVNDFGVVVNPMLVAGQIHGGVLQGIGQVLGEEAIYDENGQLLTGSFMDYRMPRAEDAPDIRTQNLEFRSQSNALGVKGCGEAGCAGSIPSVMGAIIDALSKKGVTNFEMPASPMRVWQAIEAAKVGKPA